MPAGKIIKQETLALDANPELEKALKDAMDSNTAYHIKSIRYNIYIDKLEKVESALFQNIKQLEERLEYLEKMLNDNGIEF